MAAVESDGGSPERARPDASSLHRKREGKEYRRPTRETPWLLKIPVFDTVGVARARRHARHMARSLGYSEVATEEVVLCVSELGNNLWQHAGGGTLQVEWLAAGKVGIRIRAIDEGPGIVDVQRALQDGVSSRGGLGSGLAAVRRLADELEIYSVPGRGTRVEATKWLS